jgi:hypothetical protein
MPTKLVVLVHGIGDARDGFHKEWQKVMEESATVKKKLQNVTVKGLLWEDILGTVADQYDFGSGPLGEILDMCGFPKIGKLTAEKNWIAIKDYMMDVLVYVGLQDMWTTIQNQCSAKLDALRSDSTGKEIFKKTETFLIGHSLGAAMLPHLTWREYTHNGTIPYAGMILLASPLGFESPKRKICQDFIQRMAQMLGMNEDDRVEVLRRFAGAWNKAGKNRLRFINNDNDIVCSDVKYEIPGSDELVDLIPLRQGFNPTESEAVLKAHADSLKVIAFGERKPAKIAANHDVLEYFRQPVFEEAISTMI